MSVATLLSIWISTEYVPSKRIGGNIRLLGMSDSNLTLQPADLPCVVECFITSVVYVLLFNGQRSCRPQCIRDRQPVE